MAVLLETCIIEPLMINGETLILKRDDWSYKWLCCYKPVSMTKNLNLFYIHT